MEVTQTAVCTICEQPLQGSYCHQCGQKHTGRKAGMRLLLQEFAATFFSLEKSGMATLRSLATQPERVVRNYIDGNRGYWQSPSKLLFYALLVFGLHSWWSDTEVLNMSFELEGVNPSWFFLALVLPLLALSAWLLYNPRKVNFAQHLIAMSYFWSLWFMVITLVGDLYDAFFERDLWMIDFAGFLLMVSWYQARVFAANKSWYVQWLLALLQVVLFFMLIAGLVLIIYLGGGRVRQTTFE